MLQAQNHLLISRVLRWSRWTRAVTKLAGAAELLVSEEKVERSGDLEKRELSLKLTRCSCSPEPFDFALYLVGWDLCAAVLKKLVVLSSSCLGLLSFVDVPT